MFYDVRLLYLICSNDLWQDANTIWDYDLWVSLNGPCDISTCEIGELARRWRQLSSCRFYRAWWSTVSIPQDHTSMMRVLSSTEKLQTSIGMSLSDETNFNDVVNRAVRDICEHIPGVYTWRQRCFRLHPERFYRKDRVHLNFLGMRKYINEACRASLFGTRRSAPKDVYIYI